MDIKPWSEVKISEPEAVLFIYLMFRKDYGYHIAQEFSKAIENKKWDERRGLSSLKHANRVESILIGMVHKNLLIKLPRPGVGRPKMNSIKEDMVYNPRRKYYRVNPSVLGMSHRLVLTEKEIEEIKEYIRQDEQIGCDPEELLPEEYADFACILGLSDIYSKVNLGFLSSNTISSALRLLELCAPDELSCIRFINTLKKYDCLTIFMTAGAMFTEILNYISPDEYKLRLYHEYIISLNVSEEELKKKIRRWFERRLDYITKDKDNYINNEIDHALHSKKIANLLRLDSQFLRLNNIDRKIEQVGKELRTSHPNARDLRSVIEHLDSIIIQIPYIERGFWSPLNK